MLKAPVAGRTKTRLARDVGVAVATSFARNAARVTLLRLARDPRWETVLAVTPDVACASRVWPAAMPRIGQGVGNLGARMQGLADRMPRGPVVIVGSDIPGIRPDHIARAFRELGRADMVFGPASDGGYWLVGFRRRQGSPSPFAGVRWSTRHALADTLANLASAPVGFTATLDDVDEGADLKRAIGAGRVVPTQASTSVPQYRMTKRR